MRSDDIRRLKNDRSIAREQRSQSVFDASRSLLSTTGSQVLGGEGSAK